MIIYVYLLLFNTRHASLKKNKKIIKKRDIIHMHMDQAAIQPLY